MISVSPNSPISASTSPSCFSDSLVALGFEEARSQRFEWLASYPSAKPLLEAIRSAFSPQCVLTARQAKQYASSMQAELILPDSELFNASGPLVSASQNFPDVHRQRMLQLQAAKKRLGLLSSQREFLHDAVAQKRLRPRTSEASSSMRPLVFRLEENESASLRARLEELRTAMQRNFCSNDHDSLVELYSQKEQALFEELHSYARQTLRERALEIHDTTPSILKLSVGELVKSLGDIKADHCVHEARLARLNAMLTSMSLNKGAYLEMSNSSMNPLIKDLRARGAKALKAKTMQVAEHAQDSLLGQLHAISFAETLRQQNTIIDLMRFFARLCLEQRLRILCFSLSTKEHAQRYQLLFNTLHSLNLSQSSSAHPTGTTSSISVGNSATVSCEHEERSVRYGDKLEADADNGSTSGDANYAALDVEEDNMFMSGLETISGLKSEFCDRVGFEDAYLRLDSHPKYALLIGQVENIVSQNTGVLDAILRKRDSTNLAGSQNRTWIRGLLDQ